MKKYNFQEEELLLFALLRASIWDKPVEVSLFENIDADLWQKIYRLAFNHSVIALAFDAVEKLPQLLQPHRSLLLQWFAQVKLVEAHNEKLTSALLQLANLYTQHGIDFLLIKGHSVSSLYPNPNHRQGGDVDFFIYNQPDQADRLLLSMNIPLDSHSEKHTNFVFNGVEIENHHLLIDSYIYKSGEVIESLMIDGENKTETLLVGGTAIPIPSVDLNAIFLLLHPLMHLLEGGVGLRHVCDWMLFMKKNHEKIDKKRFCREIGRLKIKRFTNAMATISVDYLDAEPQFFPIRIKKRKAQKVLLQKIFAGGNFGQYRKLQVQKNVPTGKWAYRFYKTKYQAKDCFSFYAICPVHSWLLFYDIFGSRVHRYIRKQLRKVIK